MCEFHVDDMPDHLLSMFPLRMSVRVPPDSLPIIMIGQDECVFSQFLVSSKMWVGPHKESPLLPKSEGEGRMISGMQSRDFGFGLPISEEQLTLINESRFSQNYCDTTAAMEIFGSIEKKPLSESPFLRAITIGVNNDGYWTSYHMAVQLEDCVDCLKILYPGHEFVFLFDHSQGHSKKRVGALQSMNVNLMFGGEQPIMRDSQITQGCLGTFSPKLNVGDIQKMFFQSTDEGPFYFSDREKEFRRFDQNMNGITSRPKNMKQLKKELRDAGVPLPLYGMRQADLHALAQTHGLSLRIDKQKVLPGWEGKAKGILQILWERGLIDELNYKSFTLGGQKNPVTGLIDESTSFRAILANCADFQNELSALQALGKDIGVVVDSTPKYHPELAGEGIEYSWGHAKGVYRRTPLAQKKGRDNFLDLVRKCCDPVEEITIKRVRSMARRARSYICTYFYLAQQNRIPQGADMERVAPHNENIAQEQKLLFTDIESLVTKFRSHRCALDFDRRFISSLLTIKDNNDT